MIMDQIDQAAIRFSTEWKQIRGLITKLYTRLSAQSDTEAALAALGSMNLEQILLDDMNFKATLTAMQSSQVAVLQGMSAVAPVPEVFLQALVNMDGEMYVAKTGAAFKDMIQLVTRSVIEGASELEFVERLAKTGMTEAQAQALANDTLRKFSRTVTSIQAKQDPDQLWIYEGPVDDRTSEICLEILAAGPMKKSEIEDRFPGSFTQGGHFNCRHEFHPYVRERQYEKSALDQELAARDLN